MTPTATTTAARPRLRRHRARPGHATIAERQTRPYVRCHCEYEWGVHVAFFAKRAGLDQRQIASLTAGSADDACWTQERDRLLVRAVDALHDDSDIPNDLWQRLSAVFSEANLVDLLVLTGWYHAISFAARALRVPVEDWAPTFASVTAAAGA